MSEFEIPTLPLMSLSGDERVSLFGSPPPSPRPLLALPRTRTSVIDAESAKNIENVGTTAHLGLQQNFDNVTSPVTVALPSRPPAVLNNSMPSSRTIQNTHKSRENQILGPRMLLPGVQVTSRKSTPARVLAQPLDLPETFNGHEKGLLRSHPSLLGVAGSIARVRPSSAPPPVSTSAPGHSVNDPILIDNNTDDTPTLMAPPAADLSRPLFQPRFTPSNQTTSRASSITPPAMQTCASSRDILSSAIFDRCINSPQVSPAIIQALGQSSRFRNLLKDLIAFVRTVESFTRPNSSMATFPDQRSPKRWKPTSKKVAGAYSWKGPLPCGGSKVPPRFFEEWKRERARKLMEEFVLLLQQAQKTVNNENWIEKLKENRNSEPPKRNSRKRKRTEVQTSQSKENSTLGLDQLWKILRDFNAQSSAPSASAPSSSAPNEASHSTSSNSQPPWNELSGVMPESEEARPGFVNLGTESSQTPGSEDPDLRDGFDNFLGPLPDTISYCNDTDKELESGTTGFSTPSLAEFPDSLPDVGVDGNAFSNLTLDKDMVENFDFEQFTTFFDTIEQKQSSSGMENGDFDPFDPTTYCVTDVPPQTGDTTFWDMIGPTTDLQSLMVNNRQFMLDWQNLSFEPPPLPELEGLGPALNNQAPLLGDTSPLNPVAQSFAIDGSIPKCQDVIVPPLPIEVTPSTSSNANAPIASPPAPAPNPSVVRKHAVKAKAAEQRQKILGEMEDIKKTLWSLTVEASVFKHIAIPS